MPISDCIAGSIECDSVEECALVSEAGGFSDDDSGAVIEHYGGSDGGAQLDIDSESGGGLGLDLKTHEASGEPGNAIRVGL
mmetsp:Transcript_8120/g.8321  ORF Transcript_8120/g.8321 Transcript_8120/m.8321 type:complete len:81 (+) Transcript_8120:1047-1289(+)